jgi:hypothetical protein
MATSVTVLTAPDRSNARLQAQKSAGRKPGRRDLDLFFRPRNQLGGDELEML